MTTSVTGTVTLRLPYRRWLPAWFLAIAAITLLLHLTVVPSESLWLSSWFALMALLGFAVDRWFAVVLTPAGLTDRGLRTRRWNWADITAVDAVQNRATRYAELRSIDGKAHPLRLPTVALGRRDERFVRELDLIERYWRAHR